jgi:hypothetical protein
MVEVIQTVAEAEALFGKLVDLTDCAIDRELMELLKALRFEMIGHDPLTGGALANDSGPWSPHYDRQKTTFNITR